MATSSMLQARGLATFNNYLSAVPEGSLLVAENVVIDKTGVIEPRRGITQYGGITAPAKQLLVYKDRVFAHYNNKLAFDNGSGTFTELLENFSEAAAGVRMKYSEAQGNLYLTTQSGITKISAELQSDLPTADVSQAGAIRALAGTGKCSFSALSGFLLAYSKVGYRITWGYIDNNENFVEGTPSPIIEVINQSNKSCNVSLTFQVPTEINTNYFYRIYRSSVFTSSTGFDGVVGIVINDELKLVHEEGYDGVATSITFEDITPSSIRDTSANLYTNEFSGEGILQSNDRPPFALDIAYYQNQMFFSNTRTKHSLLVTMLGLVAYTSFGAVEDTVDIVDITTDSINTTVEFSATHGLNIGDIVAIFSTGSLALDGNKFTIASTTPSTITFVADGTGASASNASLHSSWIRTKMGLNEQEYFFVGRKAIRSFQFSSAIDVADKLVKYPDASYFTLFSADNESKYVVYFATSNANIAAPPVSDAILIKVDISDSLILTGTDIATKVTDTLIANTFDFDVEQLGATLTVSGAKSGASNVSTQVGTSAITITSIQTGYGEDTSKKFIRLPKFVSAGLSIDDAARSLVKNINANTSDSVNAYYIFNPNSLPGRIQLESKILDTQSFTLLASSTAVAESYNPVINADLISSNEARANRLYFSKVMQPEAVPLVNFIDVGPRDEAIMRIVALRDSMFIFKEESIYRLSGDNPANFSVLLHDNSAALVTHDALAVLNNNIYAFTTQGITQISDTGVAIVSRSIEDKLTKVTSPRFNSVRNLMFAAGYEQDRAFFLWLPKTETDTYATECLRYNVFTQSWTSWTVNAKAAVAPTREGRLFVAPGDLAVVERERKDLLRTDYADRTFPKEIIEDAITSLTTVKMGSLLGIEKGDVLVQTQYLTLSQINRLTKKISVDPGLDDSLRASYSTLFAANGINLSTYLQSLVTKLNTDLGTAYNTDFSGSFSTIQTKFNDLIDDLNADTTLGFVDYQYSTGTIDYELLVSEVLQIISELRVLAVTPIVQGDITLHKAIKSDVIYTPISFGDPSVMKHVRAGTMLFANAALAFANLSYSSDLSPAYEGVDFLLEGDGSWGVFFYSSTSWGGEGTQRPFRTLIPRQKQRCRFIRPRFRHSTAFYKYLVYGVSFDFEVTNTRAYK